MHCSVLSVHLTKNQQNHKLSLIFYERNRKSENNRSGKITFSNMAELNLFIRKLIQSGHRDTAIDLIQTIIQRIEAKNKVIPDS